MNRQSHEFFRYPRTSHLAWLSGDLPRDDKVLSTAECERFLSAEVVVEEKVDGANLGISLDAAGRPRTQNRGQYLAEPYTGQFSRLRSWLATHEAGLLDILTTDMLVFGEWCAARHSVAYDRLPDWFVAFDVYDRGARRFWDTKRRSSLLTSTGLHGVAAVRQGRFTLEGLRTLLEETPSAYRSGPVEGLVIRRESAGWLEERAKLVQPDFVQGIDEHWRRRTIEWNRLRSASTTGQPEGTHP